MIDVHCHLNFHKFDEDSDEVIKRAVEAGVSKIVNTGTSIPSSRRCVELAEQYPNLYAIVGIHPHHADKYSLSHPELAEGEGSPEFTERRDSSPPMADQNDNTDWLEELEQIALSSKKVIGIGEVGMDYWNYRSNGVVENKLQEEAFRKQIELSIKLKLPLQIHTRLAWDDTLNVLSGYRQQFQNPPGMFHCFSGDIEFTKKVLDLGFYVGFDGNITYKGVPPGEATELSELVKFVPIDRMFIETDSPFLTPIPYRGQRNEPKNAIIVAEFVALLKGISYEALNHQIEENFKRVFLK